MTGYRLNQLLQWAQEDQLIDSFAIDGSIVLVNIGDIAYKLKHDDALTFIKRIRRTSITKAGTLPDNSEEDSTER